MAIPAHDAAMATAAFAAVTVDFAAVAVVAAEHIASAADRTVVDQAALASASSALALYLVICYDRPPLHAISSTDHLAALGPLEPLHPM